MNTKYEREIIFGAPFFAGGVCAGWAVDYFIAGRWGLGLVLLTLSAWNAHMGVKTVRTFFSAYEETIEKMFCDAAVPDQPDFPDTDQDGTDGSR